MPILSKNKFYRTTETSLSIDMFYFWIVYINLLSIS